MERFFREHLRKERTPYPRDARRRAEELGGVRRIPAENRALDRIRRLDKVVFRLQFVGDVFRAEILRARIVGSRRGLFAVRRGRRNGRRGRGGGLGARDRRRRERIGRRRGAERIFRVRVGGVSVFVKRVVAKRIVVLRVSRDRKEGRARRRLVGIRAQRAKGGAQRADRK